MPNSDIIGGLVLLSLVALHILRVVSRNDDFPEP